MARAGVTASDIANVGARAKRRRTAGGLGLPPVPQGQQMQYTVFVKGRLVAAAEFREHRHPGSRQRSGRAAQGCRPRRARRRRLLDQCANDDISRRADRIFLQPDANALDVAKHLKQVMDDQEPRFPPGMVYTIPYSTTPFVTESLKEVIKTLLIAFVLVVFVVFLFLQTGVRH